MRIPILCYHALHAPGGEYDTNDHVALEADLGRIRKAGISVVPLRTIAEHVAFGQHPWLDNGRYIGVSFDDGPNVDFIDFVHPDIGRLKSFYTILKENVVASKAAWGQATSFVIASPEARSILDRKCIAGRNEWTDTWWEEAARSGIIAIANHSWDHVHPSLDRVAQREQKRGDFRAIDTLEDADLQVRQAEDYIDLRTGGRSSRLFAYPYGQWSPYLANEYFPERQHEHRIIAAFSTAGRPVTRGEGRWTLPRFVCGEHWRDPAGLERILRTAEH